MSSAVPGKKWIPKAEQFCFYVFTQMKLGDDRMKIHAHLTHVYGVNCVWHCIVCRWIEEFGAGKVSFEDGHYVGRPVSDRNEQTVLFV